MIKCTRTERKFKVDFLENKASNEKFLFYIFDFFFRVESLPFRLYHQLPTTLYIAILRWFYCFAILLLLQVLFIFGLLLEYNVQGGWYVIDWFQSFATLRYVIFCSAFTQPLHRTLRQSNPWMTVIDMTTLAISIAWLNCASFYGVSLNAKRMSIKETLCDSWRKLLLEKQ